ncbi:MAG TPA: serine/threonine-protein kinase [Rudaea sp.]|jgi:serine/threonine-protein kinase|nr:serine/threonine-protein kinase [Rudaea sp.]
MTMRAELWQRVSALFEQSLDVEPAAREAWIAEHCAGDRELEHALRQLINADNGADSQQFMDTPIPSADPDLIAVVDVSTQQQFGPYRLLRLLGQGGMGEVHLAERADGVFEQRVALKLVPHPTPGLIQRFVQERQILARMEHPNIARLLDGGIGENGVPYFAMEYIEGSPISRYVADNKLDVVATLRLFLLVCEAVQYAHRNLVVHRDLKPSNIFVGIDGTPKLLDFGVAKVLSTTDADPTHTATRVFTPDYAAPEQILGQPVTTATDVYSLGVVLYELLTGAKPYSFGRNAAADLTAQRMDPTAPSASRTATIDAHRRRQIRGDLDRIVLTMLAREPERRYGSVEALANDIRRYLDGRPIAARGDSASYRLRKFVRRNRVALAVTTFVALAMIAATAISLWQAHRANRQASRAETVKAFLVSVFSTVNPDENGGKTITARMLLDDGAARLDREMAGEPTLRAELTDMFGNLYYDIGEEQRSEELLKRAVALSENVEDDPALYPAALIDLAQMERIRGDFPAALDHEKQALERAKAAGDRNLTTNARRETAKTLYEKSDYAESEKLFRAVLDEDTALHGERSSEVTQDTHQLALLLDRLSRWDEAEVYYKRAIELARALHGENDTSVATGLNDYALMLSDKSDFPRAESMMREALALHTKLEGPDHPHTLESDNNLSSILNGEGKFDESMTLLEHVLETRRRISGNNHPDTAVALNNMAIPEFAHGQFESAEKHLREAIAIWSSTKGADHPDTSSAIRNLAAVFRADDKFADAEALNRQALEIDRKHFGEQSETVAATLIALGRTQRFEGKYDEAFANFRQAIDDLRDAKVDTTSTSSVLAWQSMGETYLMRNDAAAAKDVLLKGNELAKKIYPLDNHHQTDIWVPLGRAEHMLGNDAEAEKLLRPSLEMRMAIFKPPNIWLAEVQVATAEALNGLQKRDEARQLAEAAAAALRTLKSGVSKQLLARAETVIASK